MKKFKGVEKDIHFNSTKSKRRRGGKVYDKGKRLKTALNHIGLPLALPLNELVRWGAGEWKGG